MRSSWYALQFSVAVGFAVLTLHPANAEPGALDTTFGNGGATILHGQYNLEYFNSIGRQPDGKIIAVGAYPFLTATRFLPNGQLDTSFGSAGFTQFQQPLGNYSALTTIAVRHDGTILVAGKNTNFDNFNSSNAYENMFLAQLTPSGALDPTFGGGTGSVTSNLRSGTNTEIASSVLYQPDGRIVVGGTVQELGTSSSTDFFLARYMPDGSPDLSFGTGGRVTTDFVSPDLLAPLSGVKDNDMVARIALDHQGRIVVAGSMRSGDEAHLAVLRFMPSNGALDSTFGAGGKVETRVAGSDFASSMLITPDNKLLIGGYSNGGAVLARYLDNGSLDPTFGPAGQGFATDPMNFWISDLAMRPDGTFVAADALNLRIASFNADGSFDTSFTLSGLSNTILPQGYTYGHSASLVLDGHDILVAGDLFAQNPFGGDDDPVIARFTDRSLVPEPAGATVFLFAVAFTLARRERRARR